MASSYVPRPPHTQGSSALRKNHKKPDSSHFGSYTRQLTVRCVPTFVKQCSVVFCGSFKEELPSASSTTVIKGKKKKKINCYDPPVLLRVIHYLPQSLVLGALSAGLRAQLTEFFGTSCQGRLPFSNIFE